MILVKRSFRVHIVSVTFTRFQEFRSGGEMKASFGVLPRIQVAKTRIFPARAFVARVPFVYF